MAAAGMQGMSQTPPASGMQGMWGQPTCPPFGQHMMPPQWPMGMHMPQPQHPGMAQLMPPGCIPQQQHGASSHQSHPSNRSRSPRRSSSHRVDEDTCMAVFTDDDRKLSTTYKSLGLHHLYGARCTPKRFRASLCSACNNELYPMVRMSQLGEEETDMLLFCLSGVSPATKASEFGVTTKKEARQAIRSQYKMRMARNASRLNILAEELDNIPGSALRLGYPTDLLSPATRATYLSMRAGANAMRSTMQDMLPHARDHVAQFPTRHASPLVALTEPVLDASPIKMSVVTTKQQTSDDNIAQHDDDQMERLNTPINNEPTLAKDDEAQSVVNQTRGVDGISTSVSLTLPPLKLPALKGAGNRRATGPRIRPPLIKYIKDIAAAHDALPDTPQPQAVEAEVKITEPIRDQAEESETESEPLKDSQQRVMTRLRHMQQTAIDTIES